MPTTLGDIFRDKHIALYQNESLDLDHYYQEPYQDEGDEVKEIGEAFETNKCKKKQKIEFIEDGNGFSVFAYFMDGSRRTYKIGEMVLDGKKIYPVVVAQVRAGCTMRGSDKKVHSYANIRKKNLLLLSDRINDEDFQEIRERILATETARSINLDIVQYKVEKTKDSLPVKSAIAKANVIMHEMEIGILNDLVHSKTLETGRMLIVDGPLQFIGQDTGKNEFADLFYNVVGVSKNFNPMLLTSEKSKGKARQIGPELLELEYGERTPVFLKENSRKRRYGFWYLRIRPRDSVSNPFEGIIKVEKMAVVDDTEGLDSTIVDNISLSLLHEGVPTCYGRDARWASHLYPIYLTETFIKSSFESDVVFINSFKKNFS